MYDVLIVGGGPAGCSAALTLRMRGKSVLLAYAGGGALEKATRVDNYPGLPRISGQEMLSLMRRISSNINQIAKRANETGRVYDADLEEIQNQQEKGQTQPYKADNPNCLDLLPVFLPDGLQ